MGMRLAVVGQVRQVAVGPASSFTLDTGSGRSGHGLPGHERWWRKQECSAQRDGPGQLSEQAPIEVHRIVAESQAHRGREDPALRGHEKFPPNPIPNLGRNRAGQTITNGENTIRFDQDGFPEFDSKFETILDDIHIGSGNRFALQSGHVNGSAKWILLASPPGCRADATRRSWRAQARRAAHGRNGDLGWWRPMTQEIRWKPYVWDTPRPATPDEVSLLEQQWGVKLPEEYKRLISTNQGMTPHPCIFDAGSSRTS